MSENKSDRCLLCFPGFEDFVGLPPGGISSALPAALPGQALPSVLFRWLSGSLQPLTSRTTPNSIRTQSEFIGILVAPPSMNLNTNSFCGTSMVTSWTRATKPTARSSMWMLDGGSSWRMEVRICNCEDHAAGMVAQGPRSGRERMLGNVTP